MAHGYELEMTPLQILNVYNAVANDGVMMRPHLTKEILKEDKVITKVSPVVLKNRIASPSTIRKAQELLTSVAKRGTARKLKIDNTSFAGKTGTTVTEYWKGGADKKKYNASFAGYFPAENPEYSMIVVVYKPQGKFYGAEVAGKVFANVVERVSAIGHMDVPDEVDREIVFEAQSGYNNDFKSILDYIGLDYNEKTKYGWIKMEKENDEVVMDKQRILKQKVPDLLGMGLRDATYVIESLGLVAEVEGVGQVYKQSISPGTSIDNQKIKIYLN